MKTKTSHKLIDCPVCFYSISIRKALKKDKVSCPACGMQFGLSQDGDPTWIVNTDNEEPSTLEHTPLSRLGDSTKIVRFL